MNLKRIKVSFWLLGVLILIASLTGCAELNEQLIDAAGAGRVEKSRQLIKDGANLCVALQQTVRTKHVEAMKTLLIAGADSSKSAISGCEAINQAVDSDQIEMARLLLKYGADPNFGTDYRIEDASIVDPASNTEYPARPSRYVGLDNAEIISNDPAVKQKVSELLKSGRYYFRFSFNRTSGKTPLFVAIDHGNLAMVKLLLAHGARAKEERFAASPGFCLMRPHGRPKEMYYLLAAGLEYNADANYRLPDGRVVKDTTCTVRHDGKYFRTNHTPSQSQESLGSALDYARKKGNPELIKLLEAASK